MASRQRRPRPNSYGTMDEGQRPVKGVTESPSLNDFRGRSVLASKSGYNMQVVVVSLGSLLST